MYESFYGLNRRPFGTAPVSEGIYWSDDHSQAFAMLRYGILSRAPVTVVTGGIGAGKTTLIRALLAEMPEELTTGLVSNMAGGQGELLDWIMMALGQPAGRGSHVETFARFQDFLVERYAEGQRVLIIVDEAQNLGPAALEELRLLTNVNTDGEELLQLVLAGQPQLRELLADPALRQFAQRISADCHLGRLSAEETAGYVAARLKAAGARRLIFPRACCGIVHEVTRGVPRLINILCDLALVYGYADDREVVDEELLREVLDAARARGIYTEFAPLTRPLTLVPGAEADPVAPASARRRGQAVG